MMPLILKELRQLTPIAMLWLALVLLGIGLELFTLRIDEQSYEQSCSFLCAEGIEYSTAIALMVMYLVTAYSLYPREVDERTIDFLHALPIKKSAIFYGKFIAAFGMVCAVLLFSYCLMFVLMSFNPESMHGKRYIAIDASLLLRDIISAFVIMAHGVFLSRFRTVGLIVYALYLLLVRWLETLFDDIAWVSVFEIFNITFAGDRFSYSWDAIAFHVAVAIILLVLANRLWSKAEGKATIAKKQSKLVKVIKVLASVFGFVFMGLVLVGQVVQQSEQREERVTQTLATDHYRFVFLAVDAPRADVLHAQAEDHYQQMRALLNAESEPVIHVDMTSESEHAAGLAQWTTIKMGLSAGDSPSRYARVLSHETAHVFQSVESGRAFVPYSNATRFFIEGMANYASFEIVPQDEAREQNRDIAAVSWKRQNIRFTDLINSSGFSKKFNAELVYSLGEIWTAALVDVCGIESLGKVLRSAGRDNAPQNLPAMMFWRTTLQDISCELELVNAAWRKRLNKRHDAIDQDRFPVVDNISATRNSHADGDVVINATVPLESGIEQYQFTLRIQKPSKTVTSVESVLRPYSLEVQDEQQLLTFNVPDGVINDARFRYQIGYQPEPGSRIYFQPWRSGSVVQ